KVDVQIEAILALPLRGQKKLLLIERSRNWKRLQACGCEVCRLKRPLPRDNRLRWPPAQAGDRRGGVGDAEIADDGAVGTGDADDFPAFNVRRSGPCVGAEREEERCD